MIRRFFLALAMTVAGLSAIAPAAYAVNPDEMLPDPALEARAREISSHLRCLVCQNQSIDDSNAQLAHDLRVLVRERLKAGATDQEVYDYLVSRYGEFVLLAPRFSTHTLILWGAPGALFVIGLVSVAALAVSRRSRPKEQHLSDEERAKIEALLEE